MVDRMDMTPMPAQSNEINAERQPVVFARQGEVFASSRDVADYFGKNHRDVMRAIDTLVEQEPGLGLRNFAQGSYTLAATGEQEHRCFDMDRRGFTLLSMGFTGKKALRWKLRYIDAFEAMEAELSKPQPMLIDYSDPAVLLGVVTHLQGENFKKDAIIAEQAVEVQKLERIAAAEGSMCITDAAKTLKVRPIELTSRMSAARWIHKRAGNKSWIAYQDKIQAGLMEHRDHIYVDGMGVERVSTRALVTAKGLVKLAALLNQPLH